MSNLGFTGNVKARGTLPVERMLSGLPFRSSIPSISSSSSSSTFDENNFKFSYELYKRIKEKIVQMHIKESTKKSYHRTWVRMNRFISGFDRLPPTWEDRMEIWAAHLANHKKHSNTIASYMSAIRHVLATDGIFVSSSNFKLAMIIKVCRLHNDVLYIRLPIQIKLLNRMLDFVHDHYVINLGQIYLGAWLRAAFAMGYYGLMRISELTKGDHTVLACDINRAKNKRKVTIYFRSSKTHTRADQPQIIQIQGSDHYGNNCPFKIIDNFANLRGKQALDIEEPFFIHQDGSAITSNQLNVNFNLVLSHLNYDNTLFGFHSYRIG